MAVRIGFDGEELTTEEAAKFPEEETEEKHGDKFDYEKKMFVYIPEKRIKQFLDEFDCVVVQDYGDDYHLSDKERQEKYKYYEAFKSISRLKHKYRRTDQYVKAMREFLKCLNTVAEKNGVYDPEKFKVMYLKGEIYINGLFMPKFVGKEKKFIDNDYLTEFILSDEDPSNIVTKKKGVSEVYTEEDCEEFLKTFTDEELERIFREETPDEIIDSLLVYDEAEDPFGKNIVKDISNKDLKKLIKTNPTFLQIVKDKKDAQKSLQNMSRYAFDITSEDLDYIERYNRKHNITSSSNPPVFKGNLMNDDDYNRYMMELDEWEEENVFDVYAGKTKSLGDIKELEFKQALERCDWNLRALYDNKDKEKILKKQLRRDKKREKELRQKLMDIDKRRKRRMGEPPVDTKKKSKKRKKTKAVKKEKKRLEKTMDNFLEASMDKKHLSKKAEQLDWDFF